jgi:phosphoglycerate dehydrogenase-like enzyme
MFEVLWPMIRWQDDHEPEISGLNGDDMTAHFMKHPSQVSDEQWANCDAIVGPQIPPEYMDRLEKCRIFVKPAVGFDEIDLAAWGSRGIPVCNTPNYGTREVADHAMALMLTLTKSIAFHNEELRASPVQNWRPALNPFGQRMSDCTVGIVGLGRIGTAAALRLKAFDMDVVFFDPYKPNGADIAMGIRRADSLEELFSQSDIVTLHTPLNAETHNLISADVLAAAKQGLILINTARGPVVDIDALHDALKNDQILAAGLDVLPEEPANTDKKLIKAWHENESWLRHRLILTPHSAFFTPQSMHDIRSFSAATAAKYLRSNRLDNCVNEDFLSSPR